MSASEQVAISSFVVVTAKSATAIDKARLVNGDELVGTSGKRESAEGEIKTFSSKHYTVESET